MITLYGFGRVHDKVIGETRDLEFLAARFATELLRFGKLRDQWFTEEVRIGITQYATIRRSAEYRIWPPARRAGPSPP